MGGIVARVPVAPSGMGSVRAVRSGRGRPSRRAEACGRGCGRSAACESFGGASACFSWLYGVFVGSRLIPVWAERCWLQAETASECRELRVVRVQEMCGMRISSRGGDLAGDSERRATLK